jgi:hypothetical protein
MRRRRALGVLLWLLVAGLAFAPIVPDPPLQSGPYVQDVTATSAVVARIAPAACAHLLELRDARAQQVLRRVGSPAARRHAIRLDGLTPGTRYRYTLYEHPGGAEVGGGTFATAPAEDHAPVRFHVVADSGQTPAWIWVQNTPLLYWPAHWGWLPNAPTVTAIGARMAAYPADLWFHAGDVVYPRGEHRHWRTAFFEPFAAILASAPCQAVAGNHDVEHDGGRPFAQNLLLPGEAAAGNERMFSFAWGPVRFLGLDTNERLAPGHPVLAFAARELAAATEPWKVLIQHHPWWSASRQGDRADLVEHLLPLLLEHRVDVAFCGNDHNYQRLGEPGRVLLVVTGGGGKSLYEIGTHPELRTAVSGYEFCAVTIDGAKLTLQVVAADGAVHETFVVDKRRLVAEGRLALDPARPADRRLQALLAR